MEPPLNLDLQRDRALVITWTEDRISTYPIEYLRRLSPSAEERELRDEMKRNPLTILPASSVQSGPITAVGAELVGRYAIKIIFSDGHDTGIYSWDYLSEIDPALADSSGASPRASG